MADPSTNSCTLRNELRRIVFWGVISANALDLIEPVGIFLHFMSVKTRLAREPRFHSDVYEPSVVRDQAKR